MPTSHHFHVLIDDQKGFQNSFSLVAKLIRIKNYKMYTTAEDMMKELNGGENPLIFVDWNLIGSNLIKGELIKFLRNRKPNAEIFILSSSDNHEEQEEAKINGANGWILKTNLIKTLKDFFATENKSEKFKVWK